MKRIVDKLIEKKKTISTMESCTGGGVANSITNIEGASEILKFSAVTYSNEYKIKMGVDGNLIDAYTVYSKEVAHDMSKKISDFTFSNYSIGITGKLNKTDINNFSDFDNVVYFCIYDRDNDLYYEYNMIVNSYERSIAKCEVLDEILEKLLQIIK